MTAEQQKSARDVKPHRRQAWGDGLQNNPRFLRRIEKARKSPGAGRGGRLESVK
jgi:hypothetical protein